MPMSASPSQNVEKNHTSPRISHWRMLLDQGAITQDILDYPYAGSGTDSDPFLVEWIPNDPRNPMLFSSGFKWSATVLVALATFGVSFASSAYAGSVEEITTGFDVNKEIATLGVSLFVLGFAVGPLLWAPLSEIFGRQVIFTGTYLVLAVFCAASAGVGENDIAALLVFRFIAGSAGSSPFSNAGGTIADLFPAAERGLATSLYAGAPFIGPTLGPVVGGFLGESAGWRWVQGLLAILTGLIWIVQSLLVPETYAPLLLKKRAQRLSKITGKVYRSRVDAEKGSVSAERAFGVVLLRPWILLFKEPIVLLLSIYMAIVYGTLYLLFEGVPIVFQEERGWSEGIGSLPFVSILIGMMLAVVCNMFDNKRYVKVMKAHGGFAPPEARLPPIIVGGIILPLGLFWFAWTNSPSIHFMVSIVATAPFGFGMVLVFLNIMVYLIDAYTIYAASVLAANSVIRSVFGAVFPLFTTYMYHNLGIHWASSIPAFLSVACLPFPFIFYRYGAAIRRKCHYAAEADAFMRKLQEKQGESEDEGQV